MRFFSPDQRGDAKARTACRNNSGAARQWWSATRPLVDTNKNESDPGWEV